MELKQLNLFLAVAEDLHFGRAAERMQIAQPALSQHVRRLERELGVELFDRAGRSVRLTGAGKAFVVEARRVVEQSERAATIARRASEGMTGMLNIGYYPALAATLAPDLIQTFLEQSPNVAVQLITDGPSGLDEALARGDIDLAISSGPPSADTTEALRIASSPVAAVVPADHPVAGERFVAASDLEGESLVLTSRSTDQRLFDTIVSACHRAGFNAIADHIVDAPELVVPAVQCGLGVGLVPMTTLDAVPAGRGSGTPVAGIPPVEIFLVRRIDRLGAAASAFWDMVASRVTREPSLDLTDAGQAGRHLHSVDEPSGEGRQATDSVV